MGFRASALGCTVWGLEPARTTARPAEATLWAMICRLGFVGFRVKGLWILGFGDKGLGFGKVLGCSFWLSRVL